MAIAGATPLDLTILAPRPLTRLADVLLIPCELGGAAIVEVAEGQLDADFNVVPSRLGGGVAVVAVAAEEPREYVEGVVLLAATSARASVVLYALVAVAVVDLTGVWVAEDVEGVGDFEELVVCCRVIAGMVSVVAMGAIGAYGFLSGWNFFDNFR